MGLLSRVLFFPKVYYMYKFTYSLWSFSYRMFEVHMDEYLDEEIEWVKHAFEGICKGWDQEASFVSRFCVSEVSSPFT